MKKCTKCLIEKDEVEFPRRKQSKDGLSYWCKPCCTKNTKINAAINPDGVKKSREKRRERSIEVCRIYKKLNKDKLKKYTKQYYELNKEKIKQKARNYAKLLKPEQKQKKKDYYQRWKLTESAKEYKRNKNAERKEKYREQRIAGSKLNEEIRRGRMIKPDKCSLCFQFGRIEGHHPDYSKPLEVIWLCKLCHMMLHKSLKERNLNESNRVQQKDSQ